jgi:hypothetical protein
MRARRPESPRPPVVIVRKRAGGKRGTTQSVSPEPARADAIVPTLPARTPEVETQNTTPLAPARKTVMLAAPLLARESDSTVVPPTPTATEATSAAQRQQRQEKVMTLLTHLMERWPQVFPARPTDIRPLAIGINAQIVAQVTGYTGREVSQAIGLWRRPRIVGYLQALIRGGSRYALDGQPQGSVSEHEREQAREELAAWYARRAAKRAASRPHPAAPQSSEP